MTKKEQFAFLLENMLKISHENQQLKHTLNKSQRMCISLQKRNIEIPNFTTHEDIRKFFTGESGTCEICENDCKLDSNNISKGFKQFCSSKCHMKWRSIRQSENNTVNRIKDRKTWGEKISKRLKLAIAEGRFTPNVTNSWCHSMRIVEVGDRTVKVRSSWEEKFLLANPAFLYEKVRIPYIDMYGESRTYIVDFSDSEGNLYEIKPSSKIGECSEKIAAAKMYCEKNNLKFFLVTEKELNENKKY
jgi:hypothetical protein